MTLNISIRADVKRVQRSLSQLAEKQLPFAAAQACTALAKQVQTEERQALARVFDRPTPFTVNSVGVKAARKTQPEAVVFIKDIAAAYLAPYEEGGVHKLIGAGKTWLNPKDKTLLNQYGNLSKTALTRLKHRGDTFIGTVKTKQGERIGGVWQRPYIRPNQNIRGRSKVPAGSNTTGRLKLLVRFGDALLVRQHFDYRTRAEWVVRQQFNKAFGQALARALATAKHH
jgi:hypothetical protein